MSDILAKAKRDWQRHSSRGGFNTTLCFTAPSGEQAEIQGLAMKHHVSLDSEGNVMSARNAHATFSEQGLIDTPYPTRDDSNEIALSGHILEYADSTGVNRKYRLLETYPDETVGVIYATLEYYNG